jgi:hypothetical protein
MAQAKHSRRSAKVALLVELDAVVSRLAARAAAFRSIAERQLSAIIQESKAEQWARHDSWQAAALALEVEILLMQADQDRGEAARRARAGRIG